MSGNTGVKIVSSSLPGLLTNQGLPSCSCSSGNVSFEPAASQKQSPRTCPLTCSKRYNLAKPRIVTSRFRHTSDFCTERAAGGLEKRLRKRHALLRRASQVCDGCVGVVLCVGVNPLPEPVHHGCHGCQWRGALRNCKCADDEHEHHKADHRASVKVPAVLREQIALALRLKVPAI